MADIEKETIECKQNSHLLAEVSKPWRVFKWSVLKPLTQQ